MYCTLHLIDLGVKVIPLQPTDVLDEVFSFEPLQFLSPTSICRGMKRREDKKRKHWSYFTLQHNSDPKKQTKLQSKQISGVRTVNCADVILALENTVVLRSSIENVLLNVPG